MWFLGIDIGTTHVKVVGVGDDGEILGPLRVRTPVDIVDGLSFHHGDPVWSAVADLVAGYAAGPAAGRGALAALTIGSFGQEEAFPVDGAGRPLFPSLAWWENWPERSLDAGTAAWLDAFEHYRMSGMRFRDNQSPGRIAHIRMHHPEVWAHARRWVDFGAHVAWRLTGEWATSSTQATHSQLFDLGTLAPDARTLERLELDASFLPAVLRPGDRIGALRSGALPGVTLAEDAAVYMGGHDQVMAAYANARRHDVNVVDSIGTAEYVMLRGRSFDVDEELYGLGADVEHGWERDQLQLGWGLPTGKVLQLLCELLCGGDFDRLLAILEEDGPSASVEFRVNDLRDPAAGLVSLSRVQPGVGPDEVVRACVRQLSERIRDGIELMARSSGAAIEHVVLTGSLFQKPGMVRHRERTWPWHLTVGTLGEPVATGAAELARAAYLGSASPAASSGGNP